jgi:RNA polymerase sigma-70 factor (ECF subfamily)
MSGRTSGGGGEGLDPWQDQRDDAELVRALNRGEGDAFDALYFRYRDWVLRVAFRSTGSREDALDVLQETFLYVARKFPGFRLRARFTTFLYPVVTHLATRARRKRARERPADEAVAATAPAIASHEASVDARADLAVVLESLSPEHRDVLLLRHADGMALEAIAETLAIPLGTVKSRLHVAVARVRADPRTRRYFDGA